MFLLLTGYLEKTYFFHLNSDGDKSYTKLLTFVETYNFVIHTFVI
jgi:flagellar capping protein FliD